MITSMSDILCVTNRRLCEGSFLSQLEKIAEAKPAGIILREKDLSEETYLDLADTVMEICRRNGTPCILHSFPDAARKLHCEAVHLPMEVLYRLSEEEKAAFRLIGASCHSVEEAQMAEKLGAGYVTAGHIFDTECKPGTPGKGLDFLKEICGSVGIPVYAIGGITPQNICQVRGAGAAGACVMSSLMQCEDPGIYLKLL
ncbi:MAG: thiamine phosphate synthase [Anaerovoracaceae bacterium]|nr:thiamine phosphate synthase [Anaerovoracaceae bacterium]